MTPTKRQVAWFVIGAALAAVVLVVIFAVLTSATKSTQIRDTQETNSPLIESTSETLKIIKGCTTPGEPCYERAQRQTADAVANINRVVILAAACASEPGQHTVEQIQTCVIARLADKP